MGIGFTEMLLVAAIALVFLGPDKFPDFAKLFVRTVRDIRSYMDDVKEEVAKEILPVKDELKQFSRYDAETYINKLMDDDDKKDAAPAVTGTYSGETGSGEQPSTSSEAAGGEEQSDASTEGQPESPQAVSDESAPVAAPVADGAGAVHAPERMDG